MSKIGVIYGSNQGDTKEVAEYIASKFDSEIINATDLTADFFH